jgi:predicted glycoside hydrolase/deacetylase ChbG (UPF0249 family)
MSDLGQHNNSNAPAVIIHADDFGETQQITLGICAAIEAGTVTSASIMANMPATDFALERARALRDRASFGVHITLCEGRPLSDGAGLTDAAGDFCGKRQLFLRSVSGRLRQADVEAEVEAQVARIAAGGVRISHLDGHKHLHQLPVVCAAVAKVARRHGIERVRLAAMRSPAGYRSPSSAVRELLSLHAERVFRADGLRFPQRLVDLQFCMANAERPQAWVDLARGPGILEVFCHPGTELADLEKPGSCRRFTELEFLMSPAMGGMLAAAGSRLVNYWSV